MQVAAETRFEIELPDGRHMRMCFDDPEGVWLGRDESCHVVLRSEIVSRKHVCVRREAGELWVLDQSVNGTLVDDVPLTRETRRVGSSSTLCIGPYRCRVSLEAEHAAQAVAPAPAALAADGAQPAAQELVPVAVRRDIHRRLLDHLDLAHFDRDKADAAEMRNRVKAALAGICAECADKLPKNADVERLIQELCDEALGLGPLEQLLADAEVGEIMVVDANTIFAERKGRLSRTPLRFTDDEAVRSAIERIVTPLGRRIDESNPLVDARLKDGSRVNAVIPPLALRGPCITIRKFSADAISIDRLVEFGSVCPRMAKFLERAVRARKNIIISGGTGSGKTTLLNVLSRAIAETERIVTIEDAAELKLHQSHVVALEARPANMEGKGAVTIRDLVKNALRMRPDRIVVGECRGGEAIDMLQAMNTGHEGSMTTTHANSPREALARLEMLCLMGGLDLPVRAVRGQIAASVDLIVQQTRFSDGSRRVTSISEVTGIDDEGELQEQEIFGFHRTGVSDAGAVLGEFRASGYLPGFIGEFITKGLARDGDYL
jgi:pilus assembly protein CpaF